MSANKQRAHLSSRSRQSPRLQSLYLLRPDMEAVRVLQSSAGKPPAKRGHDGNQEGLKKQRKGKIDRCILIATAS